MIVAYVTMEGRGRIDDCLSQAVELMEACGLRLSGTVRAFPPGRHAHPCDMDVRVLPNGPRYRIGQRLGSGSRGCRLDPDAVERLAFEVDATLGGKDLLVVNKFGKQETLGRGLRPAIAQAVELGMPVLAGVNARNLADFIAFTSGAAARLDPDPAAILAWSLRCAHAAREEMA